MGAQSLTTVDEKFTIVLGEASSLPTLTHISNLNGKCLYLYINFRSIVLFSDGKIADRQTNNSSNSLIQSKSFIQRLLYREKVGLQSTTAVPLLN